MHSKTIVNHLSAECFVKLNGKDFIPYASVVLGLNISSHVRQLEKRKAAYPDHFTTIDNKPYVSVQYAIVLERFHLAQQDLLALRKKEVDNG